MVRHWQPPAGRVGPSEVRREGSTESAGVKGEGLTGIDTAAVADADADADAVGVEEVWAGGWERAGSGTAAILPKTALTGVPSASKAGLVRPKVGGSPLRSVKSLKSNQSLDQSVLLGGASEEEPGRAEALLAESGAALAEGDVRRPSPLQSLASRRLAPAFPLSPSRLRGGATSVSILILPFCVVVEHLSLSVVEDDGGPAVWRRRCLAGPFSLPLLAVLLFL